jgi:tyrosyl-tRNA synthetase
MVHSEEDYEAAVEASQVLFGKGTTSILNRLDEGSFLDLFEGVPNYELDIKLLESTVPLADLLTDHTGIFTSRGEYRRLVSGGGLSINREKVADPDTVLGTKELINSKYILIQKGKKNYYLIVAK